MQRRLTARPAAALLSIFAAASVAACSSPLSSADDPTADAGESDSGSIGVTGQDPGAAEDGGGLSDDSRHDASAPRKDAGSASDAATNGDSSHGDASSTKDAGTPDSSEPDSATGTADAGHDAGTSPPPPPPPPPPAVDAGTDSSVVSTSGSPPVVGGCQIFPADNPWNTRIDDTTAYPVITTYDANMAPTTKLHPDWGDWSTDFYGIPWQVVPSSQALVPMTFTQSADESDPGPYPFPANALVEGGSGSGSDMHVLVLQSGTCDLFETYDSTYVGPGWSAGSGAKFNLNSDALRPDGWTSGDAAGLPIFPGLVKLAEVNAGVINHAIRFTMQNTQQAYIHPATHAAGKVNAALPPMGLRLRLKASFDTSGFTGPSLVVVTAMKQYGVILADNGSNWFISGDSDDGWTNLMDDLVSQMGKVTGSDFEAVQTGTLSTAGL